jgi:hypothetical protein
VCNIGDCHVFVFSRDAATRRWSFSHNAGESRWFSAANQAGPVQFGRCSHCRRSHTVDLAAHLPVQHTLKPGDVVVATSDGIIDCVSTDLRGALGKAQSEHAKRRVQRLLEEVAARWQSEAWPANTFCASLVQALIVAARKPSPDALRLDGNDPAVHDCGSMKPDDLVCVVSVVLDDTEEAARNTRGPPWAAPPPPPPPPQQQQQQQQQQYQQQ